MHSELIDCVVVRKDRGHWRYHVDGAQSVFGVTRARKVAKELGPPWEVRKAASLDLPDKD